MGEPGDERACTERTDRIPRAVWAVMATQLFERMGHYALLAVLVLYVAELGLGDTGEAYVLVGAFTAFAALGSMAGGFLADAALGTGRAILTGSLVGAVGALVLAAGGGDALTPALALVAISVGLMRPNLPSLIGAMLADRPGTRARAFNYLYLATNVGAMAGPIAIALADHAVGYAAGFATVAAAKLAAGAVYLSARRDLAPFDRPPARSDATRNGATVTTGTVAGLAGLVGNRPNLAAGLAILAGIGLYVVLLDNVALAGWFVGAACLAVLVVYAVLLPRVDATARAGLVAHLFVLATSVAFWAMYEQIGLSIVTFADEGVDRTVLSFEIPTEALGALNPVMVLLIGPLTIALWTALATRNREPAAILKLGLGLLAAGAGYEVLRLGIGLTGDHALTPLLWLVAFQAVMAFAEMCVGPIGLDLTHRLTLPRWRSFFTGVYFVSTAAAYYLAGVLAALYAADGPALAADFGEGFTVAGVMGLSAGVITLLAAMPLARLERTRA